MEQTPRNLQGHWPTEASDSSLSNKTAFRGDDSLKIGTNLGGYFHGLTNQVVTFGPGLMKRLVSWESTLRSCQVPMV